MARKSLPNFSDVAVPQQRRNLPLTAATPPPLFSMPLFLIFSVLLFSPLCGLGTQDIPFLPTSKAGFLPQCVFWPIAPCSTHYRSQKE